MILDCAEMMKSVSISDFPGRSKFIFPASTGWLYKLGGATIFANVISESGKQCYRYNRFSRSEYPCRSTLHNSLFSAKLLIWKENHLLKAKSFSRHLLPTFRHPFLSPIHCKFVGECDWNIEVFQIRTKVGFFWRRFLEGHCRVRIKWYYFLKICFLPKLSFFTE